MRLPLKIIALISLSLILCASKPPQTITITSTNTITKINNNWQLTTIDCPNGQLKGQIFQVHLPTTIHLDLLKNQKIPDPFFRDNYRSLQWVSQCNIKYSKKFYIVKPKLELLNSKDKEESLLQNEEQNQSEIQVIFHGIDTYSKIVFNNQQLLKTENAFQTYTITLKSPNLGEQKQNLLQIYIEPAQKHDSQGQQKNNMPFKYAHTRKACYQYSWDWAPQLVTMGIWRDVQIMVWEQIRFDYVWARNRIISQQRVVINFAVKFKQAQHADIKNYYVVVKEKGGKQLGRQNLTADTAYVDVQILKPKFWWPNGFGQPHIYDFQVQLYSISKNKKIDSRFVPYGIRTAQLDLSNKKFTVKINGYPVYCKGANYVPMDMFHPRITNPGHQSNKSYTYIKLLQDAVTSNFNMIRLWGGGQYQTNQFLQLASRKGIMIFYDFKFSDSIYPSTKQFLHNVEQEVKQQIRRARNYPALTLWCGNNQILQGVQDWGWGSGKYREDYNILFQKLIKKVVQIQNPDISYIPSSPVYGVGNYGFERGGDFHYWSVWAGGAAFQSYQTAVGPFNSEFGTQALPVWESIKQFTQQGDRSYESTVFLTHERHNSQFGTLRNYMRMYAKPSKNFQSQAYLSGVVQAFGIEIAIRAQRTSKPKSYGTLYWQFNDAWPAISWSSIDYYGRWKPLQFMAKRLYPNIAIFTLNNDSVVAINDNIMNVDVQAKVHVVKFDGTIISQQQKVITLPADSVTQVFTLTSKQIKQKQNSIVVYTEIYQNKILKMYSTKFYKPFKQLQLPQATVTIKQGQSKNILQITADKLVKNIFINVPNSTIKFDDNYFDVVPGFTFKVQILKANNGVLYDYGYVKTNGKFMSVRDSNEKEELKVVFQ